MKRYALIVGIGDYRYLTKLAKPTTDAQAMYELLKAQGDFDQVHLPLLDTGATAARLMAKLRSVLLEQGAQAEVFLYFSGHGFTAGPNEYDRQGYLAASDCRVTFGKNRELLQVENAVSFAFLNGLIGDAKLAGLAVFLDCCQSEFLIEQSLMQQKLRRFAGRGYFLSAACRSFERVSTQSGKT